MTYREVLEKQVIAISISESSDMSSLGLSIEHLKDAMAEISRHLLALGARLIYGGDLRANGFSHLLFELVARHKRDADEDGRMGVTNYVAWPVHIQMAVDELKNLTTDLAGSAELVYLALDGTRLTMDARKNLLTYQPDGAEWSAGLTTMRKAILEEAGARILLGGQTERYKGVMPGIAEEALLSLQNGQPLYLLGGFGGCARDIAEVLKLVDPWGTARPTWDGLPAFEAFTVKNLNNGLTHEENSTLSRTPHVDQAVALILRGLLNVSGYSA